MPRQFALCIAIGFIFWLIARDRKRGDHVSGALWIPQIWILILASRPVSLWFSTGEGEASYTDLEGSPLDRNVFLALILAGFYILKQRRVDLKKFASDNKWLVWFFAFMGLSCLWSDYPFVSFKRWFKDVGNIVMALVVLSERDAVAAVRILFTRCAYAVIILSVVFIRYFPDIGRYYNQYIWTYSYGGVTQNKNLLGAGLIVCSAGLAWSYLELRKSGANSKPLLLVILMQLYLFQIADSATGVVCSLLVVGIIIAMQFPRIRRYASRVGLYLLMLPLVFLFAHSALNLGGALVGLVGRDLTFTGRTDIWNRVLQVDINPVFGVGYYSFWMIDRIDWMAEGWMFQLNEAHNGYIETYLNTGLIGLCILIGVLSSCIRRLSRDILSGQTYPAVLLGLLVAMMVYNVTEAAFNRLSPMWFAAVIAIIKFPVRSLERESTKKHESRI